MRLGVGAGPTDVLAAGIGDLIAMATGAGGGRTIAGVISSHDPSTDRTYDSVGVGLFRQRVDPSRSRNGLMR